MEKIYSKFQSDKLIASIMRCDDLSDYRVDLSPDEEFLQVCGRFLKAGTKVPAHRHNKIIRESNITQEAWVVLEGSVKVMFYDLDDLLLHTTNIERGDCVVLFRGGHSLEVVDKNTLFYEFKTGPYYDAQTDKRPIKVAPHD